MQLQLSDGQKNIYVILANQVSIRSSMGSVSSSSIRTT